MNRSFFIKGLAINILVIGAIAAICAFKPKEHKVPKAKKEGIQWISFEELIKESKKNKRKVVVDVYTDWCGYCKKMDANTFSNPKVAEYVNKKYYAVKLDAESNKTFEYKGKQITERELAGQIFRVTGYPTTIYLDENLEILSPVSGYLEVPIFEKILKFYGEDYYKKQSWPDFEASYKPVF